MRTNDRTLLYYSTRILMLEATVCAGCLGYPGEVLGEYRLSASSADETLKAQESLTLATRSATVLADSRGWASLKVELVFRAADGDVSTQPFWAYAYDVVSNSPGVEVFPMVMDTGPARSSHEMERVVISKEPVRIEAELSPHKTRLLLNRAKVGRTIQLRLRYEWQGKRSTWTTCTANVVWEGE